MKLALAVPRLINDVGANVNRVNDFISEACANGASLVLFPEAVLTGLANNDDYAHDLKLAVPIDDEIIAGLRARAKTGKIWLCFGFLERDGSRIFDSAVLIGPDGEIAIHYRRINPQWRAPGLPPSQYAEGGEVRFAATPLGQTAIVICGDLFDDEVMQMLERARPRLVLFPFARCFPADVADAQKEWDEAEKCEYFARARRTGATVAAANYIGTAEIGDTSFGGAFVTDAKGEALASLPLLQEGLLYCEIADL